MRCAGIEGTSSYGAGFARHLRARGIEVLEVERPKRRRSRRQVKSDPSDAERAARAVLAGETSGVPKSGARMPHKARHASGWGHASCYPIGCLFTTLHTPLLPLGYLDHVEA